jgi:hypothetical protein
MYLWLKLVPRKRGGGPDDYDMDSLIGCLWAAQVEFIRSTHDQLRSLDDEDKEKLWTNMVLVRLVGALFGVLPQQAYYDACDWLDQLDIEHRLRDTDFMPYLRGLSKRIFTMCRKSPNEYKFYFGNNSWNRFASAAGGPMAASDQELETLFFLDRQLNPEPFKRSGSFWDQINASTDSSVAYVLENAKTNSYWIVSNSALVLDLQNGDMLQYEGRQGALFRLFNMRTRQLSTIRAGDWIGVVLRPMNSDPKTQKEWKRALKAKNEKFRVPEYDNDGRAIKDAEWGELSPEEREVLDEPDTPKLDREIAAFLNRVQQQLAGSSGEELAALIEMLKMAERISQELPGITTVEIDTMISTVKRNRAAPEYRAPVPATPQPKAKAVKAAPSFRILEQPYVVDPDPEDT